MSKLIRINTEDTNARFNETLSEDFIIEENSSIALQSATFTRNPDLFEVNPNNMVITFRPDISEITNTDADNLTIRNFTRRGENVIYDGTNYADLLANIQASLNNKIRGEPATPLHAGCEIRVHTNNANKVVFDFRQANVLQWTTANPNILHTLDMLPEVGGVPNVSVADRGDGGDLSLAKIATDGGAFADGLNNLAGGLCVSKIPTGHGAKYLLAKVAHLVTNEPAQAEYTTPPDALNPLGITDPAFDGDGAGQSGFVLGMVDNDGFQKIMNNQHIRVADMFAFCGIDNNAGRYFFGYGRNTEKTDQELLAGLVDFKYCLNVAGTYVANDKLGIQISRGKIKFPHQRANGALTFNLNTTRDTETRKLDYNRTYYWVVGFLGSSTKTRLTEVEGINDPFFVQPEGLTSASFGAFHDQTALGLLPPAPTGAPLTPIVRFEYRLPSGVVVSNTQLQNFLGFKGVQFPSPFTDFAHFNQLTCNQAHRFIAQSAVHSSLGFESYVILLNNIPLEGYDTNQDGRKNILYTIVEQRDPTNPTTATHIAFNSQYPIFMKIDNKNSLSMRQIQARIVDERYNEINTLGISSLTLLVKRDN